MLKTPLFALAGLAVSATAQTVVQGPVINANNGAHYYVLQGGTREQMAARAAQLGGALATVEDAAENDWIVSHLGTSGLRKLYIGLSDAASEGAFAWDQGSSGFRNWAAGEPSNNRPSRNFAVLFSADAGRWYLETDVYAEWAVVKIEGGLRVPQEYPSIASALNALNQLNAPGIELAPGVHVVSGTQDFSTTLTSPKFIRGSGMGVTTVINDTAADMLQCSGAWTLEHMTLQRRTNRNIVSVTGSGSSDRVRIVDCELDGYGFGDSIVRTDEPGEVSLEGCRIHDGGNAVGLAAGCDLVSFTNCTLTRIDRAIYGLDGAADFTNCTLIDCGAGGPSGAQVFHSPGTVTRVRNTIVANIHGPLFDGAARFTNCLLPEAAPGTRNIISLTPSLASDLTPLPGSPCIDAGDAALYSGRTTDAAGSPRVQGAAIDLGALESAPAAACNPDFNHDGFVDFFDYDDFVAAFEGGC